MCLLVRYEVSTNITVHYSNIHVQLTLEPLNYNCEALLLETITSRTAEFYRLCHVY
jgi:hypothetical protein